MKGWTLIIVFFFISTCFAQENTGNLDDLKLKLRKSPSDTNQVLLLCDLAYTYRFINADSAYKYSTIALHQSQKLKYITGQAWSYLLMGSTNSIRGNVPSAVSYFDKSIHLADSLHNYKIVSRGLANIGWCMFDLADYYRAIDYFKRSLTYLEKLENEDDYVITIEMNIGQAYLASKKLEEAEQYLNKVLLRGVEKNPNYGYLLNLLAALRLEQNKYPASDSILHFGWKVIEPLPDKIDKADNRYYFARLKLAQGEIQKANDYAIEAKKYYELIGSKIDLERVYKLLSSIESEHGRTRQALDYLLLSNALRDSVRSSQAKYSEFLFDQREQEKQILLHQKNNQFLEAEKRNQKNLWIASVLILLSIASGFAFSFWQKHRSNKKLLALNEELIKKEAAIADHNNLLREINASKDKLFSIIGHDLRGPLLSLSGLSQLLSQEADTLSKDEMKKLLNDLDKSLKNLFTLLENLLDWSLSQIGNIDFKAETFDISKSLKDSEGLLRDQALIKRIIIENESSAPLLVRAHPNSVNTVIRNLISNAIKFTHEGGKIQLHAERIDGQIRVSVADTGVGLHPSSIQKLFKIGIKHSTLGTAKEKGSGLGLVLCKDFIEKNGGIISVESHEGVGSTFYFTLPCADV